MILFELMHIPWSSHCTQTRPGIKYTYLTYYFFGIRVARFHLDRQFENL